MGDMNQDQLFSTGLVAAYFTLSELERIQPGELRAQNAPEWAGEPTEGHTLEQVYERWVIETDPAQSTMSDVRRALGLFSEANPEPLVIEQITRKHIQRLRDLLGEREISNQTRNKRIAGISILMGQAIRLFWVETNPTVGVKFDVKDGERTKREAFERDEIRAWMHHPVFTQHQFGSYGWSEFWIPLIALHHGMRRNEIGQLLTSDIRKVDATWVINIDGKIGGGDGKKLKTASSRRVIPMHPVLAKARFPEWVKTLPPGRLFENCPIEGNGSIGCVSKFVRDQLDQMKIDPELSLHGARHTFRTFARGLEPPIPEEVTDAIVGHAGGQQGRKYGNVPLKVMARAMVRINFGVAPKPYV